MIRQLLARRDQRLSTGSSPAVGANTIIPAQRYREQPIIQVDTVDIFDILRCSWIYALCDEKYANSRWYESVDPLLSVGVIHGRACIFPKITSFFSVTHHLSPNIHGLLTQNSSWMTSKCSTTICAFFARFFSFSSCDFDFSLGVLALLCCGSGSLASGRSW